MCVDVSPIGIHQMPYAFTLPLWRTPVGTLVQKLGPRSPMYTLSFLALKGCCCIRLSTRINLAEQLLC